MGLTAACAGIAYSTTSVGKIALIAGIVAVAVSIVGTFRIKALEGKTGMESQPAVLKLIGSAVVLLGWLVVLFGLHVTASVSGRMATSIVGLAISLAGIFFVLAPAVSKNAIWKA